MGPEEPRGILRSITVGKERPLVREEAGLSEPPAGRGSCEDAAGLSHLNWKQGLSLSPPSLPLCLCLSVCFSLAFWGVASLWCRGRVWKGGQRDRVSRTLAHSAGTILRVDTTALTGRLTSPDLPHSPGAAPPLLPRSIAREVGCSRSTCSRSPRAWGQSCALPPSGAVGVWPLSCCRGRREGTRMIFSDMAGDAGLPSC